MVDISKLIGKKIVDITLNIVDVEPNTKAELKAFVFEVSSGEFFTLSVSGIESASERSAEITEKDIQAINCTSSVYDDPILNILVRDKSNIHGDAPNTYAVQLESGKCVVNIMQCGGGSILHIEDLKGFLAHNPGDWSNIKG